MGKNSMSDPFFQHGKSQCAGVCRGGGALFLLLFPKLLPFELHQGVQPLQILQPLWHCYSDNLLNIRGRFASFRCRTRKTLQ